MKLGSLFGEKPKTLAKVPVKKTGLVFKDDGSPVPSLADVLPKKKKPGEFNIKWPKISPQKVKDYQPIVTNEELIQYLKKCEETGLAGFDWETAADEQTREEYQAAISLLEGAEASGGITVEEKESEMERLTDAYKRTPLDPWKGEICTASISAAPHESRVIPISHRVGNVFEPELSREEARKLFMDTLETHLFHNDKIIKIAINLIFESKWAAKYGKYILNPVADPLMMWVRCLQIVAPHRLKNLKKPTTGWGLKPATKAVFGVEMNDFMKLLERHKVDFFDEIAADKGDGLLYSAEDADYAVQHYQYWLEVAKQIPNYEKWLHDIEMPFQRVIGLMEYWGMKWDKALATKKREEALLEQQKAAEGIAEIGKEYFGLDINPGKSGKTGAVMELLFDHVKIPAAKFGKTGPSLDKEALIDMKFMLENKLHNLEEEKYLAAELPPNWEALDPEKDPNLEKQVRGAVRIAQRPEHPYKKQGLKLIALLQRIQSYSTLISSHIVGREKYLNERSGRIHAGYSTFTDTGRCNSFNPNGQNVPSPHKDELKIRNFFVPAPGKALFLIDFSGFELRLMAWKAKDETMIELFNNNGDMHRKTASVLTGKPEKEITKIERTNAKAGNFGISYGGTEHALQKTFKVDYQVRKTLDECYQIVEAVKTAYPRIPQYQREIVLEAREDGYVSTMYGYIRLLPGINSPHRGDRGSAERQAANTPIQGAAADVMKRCQNEVYEAIGRKEGAMMHGSTDMIAQIHDEIIFEMDDDPEIIQAAGNLVKMIMEKDPIPNFPVPVEAEASVAYKWGEKQDLEDWLKGRS
ncbi:bifunctional 3'-5' exonuclease/DNA polymerase [Sutcliffiella horikoshii]|uniref:DNA-directed DNA polymerase n=1 Tax=Sutcliffiella horikoshii TaxID=79883 RepID=A0A5D4SDW7_9BACI|nr:bifunctional 3'-5' exonuclease/DNA polymerase [Sutcliffiella horikoshii]TYS60508.1 bifunctional 3'-5' exonuclease/DNA polymerase [Sutcliffiella horikoshii]